MINKKEIVAMLLAGEQGSRLFALTQKKAKPAVSYGGKYKIIDFPLSNCANSGIDTVGVLTQYEPLELNAYIGTGGFWDLDDLNGGAYVLPPYMRGETGNWYRGTADAIYQNMHFPVGGRYRTVDFMLSNMVNAGIKNVGLLTRRNYDSLLSHVSSGKDWGLNKKRGGLYIFPPYINDASPFGEYASVMDGLRGTLGILKESKENMYY